jgi:hypothetical protein
MKRYYHRYHQGKKREGLKQLDIAVIHGIQKQEKPQGGREQMDLD